MLLAFGSIENNSLSYYMFNWKTKWKKSELLPLKGTKRIIAKRLILKAIVSEVSVSISMNQVSYILNTSINTLVVQSRLLNFIEFCSSFDKHAALWNV